MSLAKMHYLRRRFIVQLPLTSLLGGSKSSKTHNQGLIGKTSATMGFLTRATALVAGASLLTPSFAQDSYDYIVVGSGPGGGPLASNLARANYSVLLIEAGDQSTQGNSAQYPPQITWDFFVKHYADEKKNMMNNHLVWKTNEGQYWVAAGTATPPNGSSFLGVYYPRGSSVGGSSMINAMCT